MDEGVTFVLWAPGRKGPLVSRAFVSLTAEECSRDRYVEEVGRLAGRRASGQTRTQWIVLKECFPCRGPEPVGEMGSDLECVLPEWILACWEALPVREFPQCVLSGMACIERSLLEWSRFCEAGTGLYFPVKGRGLFWGYAPDGVFRRISRLLSADKARDLGSSEEWIQQTRMLYRGRTGLELKRIILPDYAGEAPIKHQSVDVEGLVEVRPPDWLLSGEVMASAPDHYVHACAVRSGAEGALSLKIPLLLLRLQAHHRNALFRMGTCLLLGGWMLLLLGACHNVSPDDGVPDATLEKWNAESNLWESLNKRWQDQSTLRQMKETPFLLTGAIGRSTPEGVRLSRIRIKHEAAATEEAYSVYMEGSFMGEDASPVFRNWMNRLRESSPLEQVENLSFEPKEEGIYFKLQGSTHQEGGKS